MCRVSVIIPNYCHASFLDQRIQSVLNQTYKDFEIIILDDCSPDDGASKQVIEKYRGNFHISHIIYNDFNSKSTFKQWAKGINLAKGEFIWIAESDDYCMPSFLEKMISAIDEGHNVVLAFCQSIWVDECGKTIKKTHCDNSVHFYATKLFIEWFMLLGNGVTNASSAIFRKDAALNINLEYTTYKGAGDRLFWIEIAEHGNIAFVDSGLNFFRQHGDNTTSRCICNGSNFLEDKKIFDKICSKYNFSWGKRIFVYQEMLKLANRTQFISQAVKQKVMITWKMPVKLQLFKWLCEIF